MMMEAVLTSRTHPEYGEITIPFPIPEEDYDRTMELLEELGIGDVLAQDCRIVKLESAYPVLERLEDAAVNVDELDYLAKRLESFWKSEKDQFQAMAHKLDLTDIQDLINLTFCCPDTTVITDFSKLEEAGRELAASREETDRARRELEESNEKLAAARAERDKVQAKLDGALPDAQAYAQIKERAAGVELDAHRRAQSVQDKAERDAERVRRQLEQWLDRNISTVRFELPSTSQGELYRGYRSSSSKGTRITSSNTSISASELDRVRAGLNRITQMVDAQEGALEGIAKVYSETAGPKIEAPMPIPEEE